MGVLGQLYDINNMVMLLKGKFESGEIDEQVLIDTIDANKDDINDNLNSLANWYRREDDDEDKYSKAIQELQGLKKSCQSHKKAIKRISNEVLSTLGVKKYSTGLNQFATRTSKRLEIDDNAVIPPQYYKQQDPKLDKPKLKQDIQNGTTIDGVSIEPHRNVTIK